MSEQETRIDEASPALRALVDEVRAVEPEVDWAKLEARLFAGDGSVRAPALPPRRVASGRAWAIGAALAVAAAFVIAVVTPSQRWGEGGSPAPLAARRAPLVESGRVLAVGTELSGGDNGLLIRSDGRIAIRLEPGAHVRLMDDGERIRFALDRGALAADVVTVPGGEPFAVDVAGRRVAVHGTHLRVALIDKAAVEVAVSEGNAVVGMPRGEGRTEGALVDAGHVGRFGATESVVSDPSLAKKLVEGALSMKTAAPLPVPTVAQPSGQVTSLPPTIIQPPVPTISPTVIVPPAGTSAAPSTTPTVVAKNGLSAEQLAQPMSLVAETVRTCMTMDVPGEPAAKGVMVWSEPVTFHIDQDGRISKVDVELSPARKACWTQKLKAIQFPVADAPTTVTREISFGGK